MTIESKLLLLTLLECEFSIFMFMCLCDELYSCSYVLCHLFDDANEFRMDQDDSKEVH